MGTVHFRPNWLGDVRSAVALAWTRWTVVLLSPVADAMAAYDTDQVRNSPTARLCRLLSRHRNSSGECAPHAAASMRLTSALLWVMGRPR